MKKKPTALQKALKSVDRMPDDWFGEETANFDELPSVAAKRNVTRASAYIKNEDLAFLKSVAKRTRVSVAQITGDIVSQFVEKAKKSKKG